MSKARQLAQKPSQPTGRKNIIINGGMTVDQRNETKTSSGFSLDRVYVNFGTVTAALSAVQSTEAPAGFANSLKIACTTADTSLGVSEAVNPQWRIEGQDLQQLQKGSSGARPVTLSFWVRSSKTGTYVFELKDQDNTRNISKAFTVDTADTWEKKEIVYEGDTTGAFDNDNNNSLSLILWMVAGTTYSSGTLQTSWGAQTQANRAVGVVNFVDSTSNDFYITGVQLEVGSTATDFEHRSYNEEVDLCRRYCQRLDASRVNALHFGRGWDGTTAQITLPLFRELRSDGVSHDGNGSLTKYGDMAVNAYASNGNNITGFSNFTTSGAIVTMLATLSSSVTAGGNTLWWSMDNDAYFIIEDEL